MSTACAALRAEFRPGDLIDFAPTWLSQLGQRERIEAKFEPRRIGFGAADLEAGHILDQCDEARQRVAGLRCGFRCIVRRRNVFCSDGLRGFGEARRRIGGGIRGLSSRRRQRIDPSGEINPHLLTEQIARRTEHHHADKTDPLS